MEAAAGSGEYVEPEVGRNEQNVRGIGSTGTATRRETTAVVLIQLDVGGRVAKVRGVTDGPV